ncbi:transporter substrate-binding domain-containing protein [Paenibacillus protaetiae]|uniref:Transporter substrate-binding domain-containing protein n=1 Tax=Paenibacillus protaetiae TaxID=2509456 RepID=A0A4P6ESA6_9BACL|nr:transporter substrate-binding domain-containing protein [Paenibacillus protaetiae]QAY65774.1 transporter substrate-binding domain-containing protein [Paenibacillus protaetiae]
MYRKWRYGGLAAVCFIVLLLAACGGNSNGAGAGKNGTNGTGSPAAGESNLLEQIKASGVLKVGLMGTYAPYNFLNKNKELDGFDVDIAKEVAKRLGVKAEFVTQDWSGMIAGLQAKKFDAVISQMTITDERKQQMDFSDPYITNDVKIIVKDSNTSITKVEDFKGKNIGVGLGTNDETFLRTELMPKVGKFTIKTYDDVIMSLADLNNGRIDATINNIYALKPIIDENGYKIKAVGKPLKSDQAGIAVRKNNPELVEALNTALNHMRDDGTYTNIFKKWFGEEPAAPAA